MVKNWWNCCRMLWNTIVVLQNIGILATSKMLGLLKHQKRIFFLWGFDLVLPLYLNLAWTQTKFYGLNVRHVFRVGSILREFDAKRFCLIIFFLVQWTFMAIAAVKLPCGNVVDSIDIFACGAILHVLRKRMNIDSIKLFCFINQPFYK